MIFSHIQHRNFMFFCFSSIENTRVWLVETVSEGHSMAGGRRKRESEF